MLKVQGAKTIELFFLNRCFKTGPKMMPICFFLMSQKVNTLS